ncbi:MAG: cell division protein FtsA [Bacteroidales bacterium]|nr:cell division protein FtsA [Bacteroidales bacterium]
MEKIYSDENIVVGLDIGTTKIATVVGYRDENDQIEVIGWGKSKSSGVEFGEIHNITRTVEGIQTSKELAANHAGVEIESVYAGIAGHHIKTSKYNHTLYRLDTKDPISAEEIKKLKEDVEKVSVDAGEKIIDVIPQSYLINKTRVTTDPVGEIGSEVIGTYQIITGKDNEIEKIIRCGTDAGLELKEIILEPLASAIACLSEEEKQGVALIDIGGGTTDLIIYVKGSPVYTKVISIGGDIITKDIAQVCKISEDTAEKLKVEHGTCVVDKSNANLLISIPKPHGQPVVQINENYLAQIINCRVQGDILGAVKREIDHSGYKDMLYSGLVLTGGGSQLKHLKELCQFTLGMPTRIGIPDVGFSKTNPSELKNPMFSTVLGLLKYGIEMESFDNTPDEPEKGRRRRKKSNSDSSSKTNSGILDKVRDMIKKATEQCS